MIDRLRSPMFRASLPLLFPLAAAVWWLSSEQRMPTVPDLEHWASLCAPFVLLGLLSMYLTRRFGTTRDQQTPTPEPEQTAGPVVEARSPISRFLRSPAPPVIIFVVLAFIGQLMLGH